MKTLKLCIFSLLAIALCVGAGTVSTSNSRREKAAKCWGRIKVVTGCADFQVRIVEHFADLNVKQTIAPSAIGEWQFVEGCEDWSVQFVDAHEDFSITFSPFPGLN